MAEETGCRVVGIDIHEAGIGAARSTAAERGLSSRAEFHVADAREPLRFAEAAFDGLTCIDAMNHLYERERVLSEWHRVLRPGGRLLFTDPITVTGMLRREEMTVRSGSMGEFVFSPPGVDEELVRAAGFVDVEVVDATENAADVAARWHEARARFREDLDRLEGPEVNEAFQDFLEVVGRLARERRLSRPAYVATRP